MVAGLTLSVMGLTLNMVDVGIFGIAMALACLSGALMCCVRSDRPVKRALEVVFALASFGAIIGGYFLTGSLLLAVLTVFIAFLVFVGFTFSYIMPKLRSKMGKV